eukprot:GHVP01047411.1.p1 GENE.GHVP01047411.1~~GHVP01047411.1.p1  ORF type:complete len:195 (+),score=33.66 GHVP01047411.1:2-586(+)
MIFETQKNMGEERKIEIGEVSNRGVLDSVFYPEKTKLAKGAEDIFGGLFAEESPVEFEDKQYKLKALGPIGEVQQNALFFDQSVFSDERRRASTKAGSPPSIFERRRFAIPIAPLVSQKKPSRGSRRIVYNGMTEEELEAHLQEIEAVDYNEVTVVEMKNLLRTLAVKSSGRKEILKERLKRCVAFIRSGKWRF